MSCLGQGIVKINEKIKGKAGNVGIILTILRTGDVE